MHSMCQHGVYLAVAVAILAAAILESRNHQQTVLHILAVPVAGSRGVLVHHFGIRQSRGAG